LLHYHSLTMLHSYYCLYMFCSSVIGWLWF